MVKEFEDLKKELEKLPEDKQKRFIKHWLEELNLSDRYTQDELRDLGMHAAWDFLKNEPDLYQEYLKK